jgi:hypothetical protein
MSDATNSVADGVDIRSRFMKTMTTIFAVAVAVLGSSAAYAEGNGGAPTGYETWQTANGNPTIPATQWFAMTPEQRVAKVQQMQQRQADALWPEP